MSAVGSSTYANTTNVPLPASNSFMGRMNVGLRGVASYIAARVTALWMCVSQFISQRIIGRNPTPPPPPPSSFRAATAATSAIDTTRYRTPLLDFYRGNTPKAGGVTREQILAWDDADLVDTSRYSAWMFPLNVAGTGSAPVLDHASILAFQQEPVLKANLLLSFSRMLGFYGLQLDDANMQIHAAANIREREQVWLTVNNPHFKTITRILWSLSLLGLEGHARAFKAALDDISSSEGTGIIGETFLRSWSRPFLT